MAIDTRIGALAADPASVGALRAGAREQSPETLREVARQFESLFARMLIKSMREASLGEGMFDSEQSDMYRDMFDQQMSVELAQGRGLGLADLLVRQLSGGAIGTAGEPATAPATGARPAGAPAAGTPAPVADRAASWPPASREDFVRALWPHAQAAGRALGVDPSTIVSHAALETGWGRSMPGATDGSPSFNLFGIKAGRSWGGGAAVASTLEFEDGVAVRRNERFRSYESLGAGVSDYARLLGSSPRYAAARNTGSDVAAFAAALQRGGYATDPDYAAKLGRVAESVRDVVQGNPLKVADARPLTASRSAT